MPLTDNQVKELRSKLVQVLANKAFTPDQFSWQAIENGINALSDDEKNRIAKSLVGSGDDIVTFIKSKLRDAIITQIEPSVDSIIASGYVPIDFLYEVLL